LDKRADVLKRVGHMEKERCVVLPPLLLLPLLLLLLLLLPLLFRGYLSPFWS